MKLKEMADVSSAGIIKYEEVKVDKYDTEVVLLTGTNISERGNLSLAENNLKKVFVEDDLWLSKKLEAGDIVFMSRGSSLRAAVVREEDTKLNLLPSPNFLVIKAKENVVLPEVVVTFLNSGLGQQVLDRLTTGSSLRNVSVGKLKEIDLILPTKEKQALLKSIFYKNIEALVALDILYDQHDKTFQAAVSHFMGEQ